MSGTSQFHNTAPRVAGRGVSRRAWLRGALAAGGIAALPSRRVAARQASANDRIQLAFIGLGMMGRGHLGRFLSYDDVQVVAVCDVVAERRRQARETVESHYARTLGGKAGIYRGCDAYVDFRPLVERADVDAVVIATPDHWHVANALPAVLAGKDVYCEKPLTHSIAEGRRLVQAVRDKQVVFQTGSQQRSEFGGRFRQAVELIRNGRLGKLRKVQVGVGGPPVPCDLETQPTPPGTDWDLWLGPAAYRGYHEVLCPRGIHQHFPAWRKYREFGGGALADMGAHHFDIAQWALEMDEAGPVRIVPPQDAGEGAAGEGATTGLQLIYASGVVVEHGGPSGCTFEGERGTIHVDRPRLTATPQTLLDEPLGDDARRLPASNDHRRNWIECIRSRKLPICDVEVGHRSATVCHLANLGYRLRQTLDWDPVAESFRDQAAANALLDEPRRSPW